MADMPESSHSGSSEHDHKHSKDMADRPESSHSSSLELPNIHDHAQNTDMADRPESSHSSSLELPNIHGINKPSPHPEEWTLPHEWNIEKRELFDNWKMDVQNQISHIANNLVASLNKHPREDLDQFDYSDAIQNNEVKKRINVKERQAGTSLNYGLARVAFPDKY